MEAAAAFKDALNGVQATTIEQCMEEGENEEAYNHALDLLTKPYLSLYHKGVAHLALASICLPQAQSGHQTLDIKLHIRSALESFQTLLDAAQQPPQQSPPLARNNGNAPPRLLHPHPLGHHPLHRHPSNRSVNHPTAPTSNPQPTSHPTSNARGQLASTNNKPLPLPPHPSTRELNSDMSFVYDAPDHPTSDPTTHSDASPTYTDEDSNSSLNLSRQTPFISIERLLSLEARALALREEHRRWVRFGERNLEREGRERERQEEEYEDSVEMVEMGGMTSKGQVVVGEREVEGNGRALTMLGFV